MKKQQKLQKNPEYKPNTIESYWQEQWNKHKLYSPNLDTAKRPFYNLMMFPYPSAEGMHVGNMYAFTGTDIYGRFKRMQGYDVFEPIGLDGFGIHSENYAIKIGKHPLEQAKISQENFYRQLKATGNGYDWTRVVETYDVDYYRWTQWVFIKLFKAGLAYRKKAPVNYCPSCKTVLSDEQVIDGKCERCSTVVEKRELEQWFFKITGYVDRLLSNLTQIDWAEKVKIAQKVWIGKSQGALIEFKSFQSDWKIDVFTTRPDTLHGATFIVISPEHRIIQGLVDPKNHSLAVANPQLESLKNYVSKAGKRTEQERRAEGREKTGVFTGLLVINPVTLEKIPVWTADYVLMGYGAGAIMAVPAHDQRDLEFARKYNLNIKKVIKPDHEETPGKAYVGQGTLINSNTWNGLRVPQDISKVIEFLEKERFGKKEVTYHLRDWLISRQRYWGPPIPMIYCQSCAKEGKSWFTTKEAQDASHPARSGTQMVGWYPVTEEDLPVKLPYIKDFKPLGTGKAPLANHPEFYKTTCPQCGSEAKRETDVSDTFLDSAWYFLRYTSTEDKTCPWKPERVKKWLPVTMYIGGAEHSVLHLLYARFLTMAFKDMGLISHFEEPFAKFYAHGLLIKEGVKMSKSKGNVVIPDEYIKKFGADTLRTYLMFLGPFSAGGDFYDSGIEGIYRFLKRVWTLIATTPHDDSNKVGISKEGTQSDSKTMHQVIKGVTDDMKQLRFNTAIAQLMTYYNYLSKKSELRKVEAEAFLKLLAPFAPHLAEELYQQKIARGPFESIHLQSWPEYDPAYLKEQEATIVVQINGKMRDTLRVDLRIAQNQLEKRAREGEKIKRYLEGKKIKKVVNIEGKVINFVTE